VDKNTASAQESSALSQELLSEMENAMELIDQYKLRA
jgi:methyl-accepting chemotaxis protein